MALDFDAFTARAREIAAAVPPEYMAGIDIVDVHPEAMPHPHVSDVFTLGTCETSHLSDPTGQEPFRSVVHVYYGSFAALAEANPAFDMEGELEETIEHEVQHHLEDRAGWKDLRDEDALFEAHARFRAGMEVPAGWYRYGDPVEPGLWAVDLDLFLELDLRQEEWSRLPGTRLELRVLDENVEIDVPEAAESDEIWTFAGEGLIEGDEDEEEVVINDPEGDDSPSEGAGDLHVVLRVR